jgi:hypothetical protein
MVDNGEDISEYNTSLCALIIAWEMGWNTCIYNNRSACETSKQRRAKEKMNMRFQPKVMVWQKGKKKKSIS